MSLSSRVFVCVSALAACLDASASAGFDADYATLGRIARETVATAALAPGDRTPRGVNSTGRWLHRPGGGESYGAFWIRDAAMMLGADLISAHEIEDWIELVAATQPGPEGLTFEHGLFVPGYSIPDHINVNGRAVWYPGTYRDGADQGNGRFGFLPPADDAFYFIQMVRERISLGGRLELLRNQVGTGWGSHSLIEVCDRAFDSVVADPATGLVVCSAEEGRSRVDWGFCDTVKKSGLALFPSILRCRAARDLAYLHAAIGDATTAESYRQAASAVRAAIAPSFLHKTAIGTALLISATGQGKKDDIWGSSFAVAEDALDRESEAEVCRGLRAAVMAGIVVEGQVRAMPAEGPFGGYWEDSVAPRGQYQNGGYWGTMSGWLIIALQRVDPVASANILHALVAGISGQRAEGAPWEWINPSLQLRKNRLYCGTVAMPYTALARSGLGRPDK